MNGLELMKNDPHMRAVKVSGTVMPEKLCYLAMHNCYSEKSYSDDIIIFDHAERYGELVVKHLLKGNKGHYGILEHPTLTISLENIPHNTMQQLRTHRMASFACQSMRYTGERILQCETLADVEKVIYICPVGTYKDRQGNYYEFTEENRQNLLQRALISVIHYRNDVNKGMPFERARGMLPFDYRQNVFVTANLRSWMHILDLRYKQDAQLEIQYAMQLCLEILQQWAPSVMDWYIKSRLGRCILAP